MSLPLENSFKNNDEILNELNIDLQKIISDGVNLNEKQCQDILKNLCEWLCSVPQNIVYRINTLVTDKDIVSQSIKNALQKLYPQYSHLPEILTFDEVPELIIVKSWAETVQMDFTIHKNEIIVDTTCGAAVLRGAHIYAPGIMGMPYGLKVNDTVSVFIDTTNNCKKGLYKNYQNENKLFIGNGIVNITREEIFGHNLKARGIAILMTSVISRVPQLNDSIFLKGSAVLQNLPSIICTRILNPQAGETVLDMCAAPGNKTTHIGALMNNEGTLIALEKNKGKITKLKENCKNFCLKNVKIFCVDSTKVACNIKEQSNLAEPPFPKNSFDRILLDGPCSALGKRPQIQNSITISELHSYVPLQRKLFSTAFHLLKPGGTLVYSTCTITIAENEGIVAWALRTYPTLQLQSIPEKLKCLNLQDYASSAYSVVGLIPDQSKKLCRFGPKNETIGFFISSFTKQRESYI